MGKKVLIIEPHSDDSAIAAGGYLHKCSLEDCKLYFVLVSASSLNLRHKYVSREERIREYISYVNSLGGKFIKPSTKNKKITLPIDNESKLDTVPRADLVNAIEEAILEILPDEILVMGPSFHHDHTIVYEAVKAATRPTFKFCPKTILVMENPTYIHKWEELSSPNNYCLLSEEDLERKFNRFKECFPSQIRDDSNYLSKKGIKKWAQYRGMESRSEYAEAFFCLFRLL